MEEEDIVIGKENIVFWSPWEKNAFEWIKVKCLEHVLVKGSDSRWDCLFAEVRHVLKGHGQSVFWALSKEQWQDINELLAGQWHD